MTISPEFVVALDLTLLAAATLAIAVGVRVLRRLGALQAARAEFAAELHAFSARAEAAEACLARLTDVLGAEAVRRAAAAAPPPVTTAAPAPAARNPGPRADHAILAMQ